MTRIKPVFNYFGSKFYLAKKLLCLVPNHHTYIEPFCGSAAMFFLKQPSPNEILNDVNNSIFLLFQILQNPDKLAILCDLISLTPYSRKVYENSQNYRSESNDISQVYNFLICSNMGFGGIQRYKTGWKTGYESCRSVAVWNKMPIRLSYAASRLKKAQIDCRPAIDVILRSDRPDSFFFIDPPYPYYSFLTPKHCYDHSMTDTEHNDLILILSGLKGKVMITMYQNPIYDQLLDSGFHRFSIDNKDMHKTTKTESIYINYNFSGSLFSPLLLPPAE